MCLSFCFGIPNSDQEFPVMDIIPPEKKHPVSPILLANSSKFPKLENTIHGKARAILIKKDVK